MQFSRTWKVLEKEKFFRMAMEKLLHGAILKYPEMEKS